MTRPFGHEPMSFGRMLPGVKALVVANAAVYLLSVLAGPEFYRHFGLVPRLVIYDRWVWQVFTYMFVHGSFLHVFFNLFMLWMFGMAVEGQWGTREFVKFYFICGLGVAAVALLIGPNSSVPLIGASGAIYGLLVAFAMLYPEAVVYLYFFIPIKAAHMAILCGVIEFVAMATDATPGVARFAHLAGMIIGYLYIRWWWGLKLRIRSAFQRSVPRAPQSRANRPTPSAARRVRGKEETSSATASMEDVDRVLDKILASGLESLTDEEREVMRIYSDRMKQ